MPSVFVTRTGSKYHARADLECLENARDPHLVDLETAADGGLRPCIVCGAPELPDRSESDIRWLRTVDDWQKRGVFESMWEQAFARRVLAQIPDLDCDHVEPQAYVNASGATYKVDFLLPQRNIVIEIDGYAKDGSPPSQVDLERRNRRDSALHTAGFTVVHFSNAQVQSEPSACVEQIAGLLSEVHRRQEAPTGDDRESGSASSTEQPSHAESRPRSPSTRWGIWAGIGALVVILLVALIAAFVPRSSGTNAQSSDGSGSQECQPINGECPNNCPIKGNINDDDEIIFHIPGQQFYERVTAERCFATTEAAKSGGFRASMR